jgi:putative inorganic carbon (HCO3(-)) transporter
VVPYYSGYWYFDWVFIEDNVLKALVSFFQRSSYFFGKITLPTIVLYSFLLLACIGIAFLVTTVGLQAGVFAIIFCVGIPALIYMIINLRFGVIVLLVLSFFLSRIGNFFISFPLGTVIDLFILFLLIGLLIKKASKSDYTLAKSPVSLVIWVWIIYNFLQFFNPMQGTEAWVFAIRSMAGHVVFYFIVLEIISSVKVLRTLLTIWIVLAVLGALYGLFQEFHGLLQIEKDWLMSNPRKLNLYTYHGKFRIFSFFNDPTVFGILMSLSSLLCFFLLYLKNLSIETKIVLICSSLLMLLAVMYTGTRTAYAIIPAGFGIHALLTFQKRTLVVTGLIFMVGAAIIFSDIQSIGPLVSKSTLSRLRSAFRPSDDASYLVRVQNQAVIKPFIQSHPIGAGIGTLGTVGKRFNPDAALTGFDADSMYVKVAVELGWIGLIIYCTLIGVTMILAIRAYFKMLNPDLKVYLAGIFAILYAIIVANFTQMVTLQLPTAFIFYILLASVVKLIEFDKTGIKK